MHVGGCNSIYAIRVLRERRVHTGCVSNPFFLLSAQSLTFSLFISSIILLLFTLTIFRICFFSFYFRSSLLFYLFHLFFFVSRRPYFSLFFFIFYIQFPYFTFPVVGFPLFAYIVLFSSNFF